MPTLLWIFGNLRFVMPQKQTSIFFLNLHSKYFLNVLQIPQVL